MNKREWAVMERVDDVIREIATLTPRNPADIVAISGNLRIAVAASKELVQAVGALRRQDWQDADDYLRVAERVVAPPPYIPAQARIAEGSDPNAG